MLSPDVHNIFTPFRRRGDFPCIFSYARSKGHGADKFSAEFSARISPFNELIRCIERQHLAQGARSFRLPRKREAMAHECPEPRLIAHNSGVAAREGAAPIDSGTDALLNENRRLREVVIYLSEIIIRDVLSRR